ncbi:hypothetical protein CSO01_05400 [Cellulomonas soli]|uniref:Uncharacterized protein n=1 Tax=Cellulomonas soli TaxID=931535 RepID=A0A512P9F1_9CELL|nr:hypothetical protein [Cellulomonas soli]GEP67825.1 hypothetical protein CSO01_05400 [Cellulomonas soli]
MPGFVYQASKRAVAGPDPEQADFSAKILHAIVSTAAFGGIYAFFLGKHVVEYARDPDLALAHVQRIGVAFVVLALVVPWVVARVSYWILSARWFGIASAWVLDTLRLRRPYDSTPTAWDWAFKQGEAGWVRVRLDDGLWLGGFYGWRSYASSYPYPQEVFVEQGWVIDVDGTFTDVCHAPNGMVIKCDRAVSVDFLPLTTDTEEQAGDYEGQEAS